jgi:hypothetical protein
MWSMVQNVVTERGSKKQFGVVTGIALCVALTLTTVDASAQIRQFATSATASSEYNKSDPHAQPGTTWSAREMIGAPNQPKCGDYRGAWAPSPADGGTEFVELGFATPVYATQLNVYETSVPGSIVRVEFFRTDGADVVTREFVISTPDCPRIFTVNVSTPFLTNRVKLTLNTSRSGWEEIDAVELVGTTTATGGGGNNGAQAQLVASPAVVAPGQTITVQLAGAAGNDSDWISIYAPDTPDRQYDKFGRYQFTKGLRNGTLTFTAPSQPGQYEFRLFCCNGYELLARSNPFTVAASGSGGGNNGGSGGQPNRPPFAPTLVSPANNCSWNPAALDPSSVTLQWANNGDPDGDAVTFEVDLQQYNAYTGQWVTVLQKVVAGTALTVTNLQLGSYYNWVVFAMDLNKRSNPWFARSGVSCFATTSDGIEAIIYLLEGGTSKKTLCQPSAPTMPQVATSSSKQAAQPIRKITHAVTVSQTLVKVYTISGQLVYATHSEASKAFARTSLANGVYLVVVERRGQDGRVTRTVKTVAIVR